MKSRVDRLRDGVARLATRIAERRAEQLAEQEAAAGLRPGAGRGYGFGAEDDPAPVPEPGPVPGAGFGSGARSASGSASASGGAGLRGGAGEAPRAAGPAPVPVRQTSYVPAPPGYAPSVSPRPEPATVVPWGVRVAAEAGWRLLILAGVIYVLIQVISSISLVVLAFSAALLITALLQPTVARLRRHGVARGLATAIAFITGFVVIGLIGWFVSWQVSENLQTLTSQMQDGIAELKRWAVKGPFHVSETQINHIARNLSEWLGDNSKEVTTAGLEGVTVLLEFLSGVVLTMFCTLFLLYDGRRIWNWVVRFVPGIARGGVMGAGPRVWATLTGYVRGTVIVALIDALCIGIGLWFLDVPMAVPLAVFIFLFAFIPIVGAVVSGALAVLVAIVTNGLFTALMVLVVVLAVQQIEGHVLQPFILGRLVRVHPLGVVLSVTGGSLIAGIPGAVVAVPLVAVLNTAVGYLKAYGNGTVPPGGAPPGSPLSAPTAPAPPMTGQGRPLGRRARQGKAAETAVSPSSQASPSTPVSPGAGTPEGTAGASAPSGAPAASGQGESSGGRPSAAAVPPRPESPPATSEPGAASTESADSAPPRQDTGENGGAAPSGGE